MEAKYLKFINNMIVGIKDTVFPNICLCGKWGTTLCEDCASQVSEYKTEFCPLCRKITELGRTCKSCRGRSFLTGVMVFGKHQGMLKEVIWRYKYEFIKDLSQPLARLLLRKYADFIVSKNFVVTFVPSSKSRLTWRGFNQGQLVAQEISEKLELEYRDLLSKDEIIPQVGLKRNDRIKNIEGKIRLENTLKTDNKRVLIIDDVYTSGSTLEECAKVLRQAGFNEVWGLVLSRE